MFVRKHIYCYLKLLITVIAVAVAVISMSISIAGAENVNVPTGAFSSKLENIYSGDIDLYSNYACTKEVFLPVGSRMSTSTMFHVKSPVNGKYVAGWQCYIYANAVYNKLFGEYVGNASSLNNSRIVIPGGSNTASFEMFYNAGVRCGAYMRTTVYSSGAYNGNKGHSLVILYYDVDSITYIEGNADGNGLVQTVHETWSQFNRSELSGRSRYISHVVQPKDDYYTLIYGNGDAVMCAHNNLQVHARKQPTCNENGYEEFSVCCDCGMMLGEYKILPKLAHSGGTATCYKKAVCTLCNQPYGNYLSHNFVQYADENFLISEANCISGKIYALSCEVCGYKANETFVVGEADGTVHTGEKTVVDYIEATCTSDGYTGDTICLGCNVVIEKGNETPMKTHNFEENNEGISICTHCGEEKIVEIQPTESVAVSVPTHKTEATDDKDSTYYTDDAGITAKSDNTASNKYGVVLLVVFFSLISIILVIKKRLLLVRE